MTACCPNKLYRPNVTVKIPAPVISCEIPPYPELKEVESLEECPPPAEYCLDHANVLKLLSNEIKKRAWKSAVLAGCKPPSTQPAPEPTVEVEDNPTAGDSN